MSNIKAIYKSAPGCPKCTQTLDGVVGLYKLCPECLYKDKLMQEKLDSPPQTINLSTTPALVPLESYVDGMRLKARLVDEIETVGIEHDSSIEELAEALKSIITDLERMR